MSVLPVQWHAVVLGLFSSIIAPFGGFFSSGFKRAFKNKMVMGRVCVYIPPVVYRISKRINEAIMDQILMNLTFEEQRALFMKIKQSIQERQFEITSIFLTIFQSDLPCHHPSCALQWK